MTARVFIVRRLKRSKAQEMSIARALGGRRTAGSGNQVSDKGDVSNDDWLGEAKDTKTNRFGLTLALWRKIEHEAQKKGKLPYMVIEMAGRRLVVVRFQDFEARVFF